MSLFKQHQINKFKRHTKLIKSQLKNIANKYLRNLAYIVGSILPKRNIAVLRGFPAFEDNLLSVYDALLKKEIGKIVWAVDDLSRRPPISLDKKTKFIKRGSVIDVFYSLTSRYIFITHGHFLNKIPKNQISINLWHGIPFKRIGKMLGVKGRSDTFLVATSEFTKAIFEQSFDTSKDNILITGQPRTDRMIGVNRGTVLKQIFTNKQPPRFLFLWLPTFRSTNHLKNHLDGEDFKNVFNCSDFSIETFNSILKKHDAICIVKPHPMAVSQNCANESNVLYINEDWLHSHNLSLYELIGATDCLISDISSVIADFMLLDKPTVLLFEDIDQYENSRGFSFNPITSYLPAEVTRNFHEFIVEIEAVLMGHDIYADRRNKLKQLFFNYSDRDAAMRILDVVMPE